MGGWRLGLSLISWITAAGVVTGSQCRLQDPPQIVALYDEQYLQYPNDSTSYPNNADCGWLLHTMYYDYVVHVTFTFLDVHASSSDCADDYVQVFDGSNSSYSLGRLCGSTVGEFYSSAKYLLITFHSDSSTTRGGFRLRYGAVASWEVPATSENKCPFKATQPIGVIAAEQFLQYPVNSVNYPDNADCGWLLEAGSNNYVVHVNFTFVDVEDSVSGCPYDYLKVFDGPNDEARSLGTFCGSRLLQFQSSLRSLYITFHSDTKGTRAGFRLTYQALGRWGEEPTADGSCSLYTPSLMAVSSADQFIQYPSSSLKDSRGGDCGWLLETDIADYVMHVNLSLVNIEAPSNSCVSDYIEVFDGLCGHFCRVSSWAEISSRDTRRGFLRFPALSSSPSFGFLTTRLNLELFFAFSSHFYFSLVETDWVVIVVFIILSFILYTCKQVHFYLSPPLNTKKKK
ncbi:deleted in malignant brain tumors 1 protein-like isoform X2 [Pomacea canaliculata]|uniref:deleted in malignant brain tumors 1 protein-like isoform X2 n=1 Tax=Pomacea canaliculata TaxID=400727 RepID=UPI000D73A987|nr:deleted in malignant brain tumors 1 protein-like isoform X2 [Pomacea canaliculata]